MLKELRKKQTSKMLWIILSILVLPSFVLWGFGSYLKDKKENQYAGKIFGKKVSLADYKDSFEATKNQAIIQFGDKLTEVQKYLNLESQAWDRLVLLSEAKKRKITVSDKEVIAMIESYPFFQNKKGFSEQVYAQLLRYAFRTQARAFEEQTRQNLMLAELYKEVTVKITVNDDEVKKEYKKTNEQVSISYITANPADFEKEINVKDEQVAEYFTQNQLKFKRPISYNIEYMAFPFDEKNETQTKEKIKNLMGRLNKKEDFQKVAKSDKLEIKESGLFAQGDPVPGIGWAPELIKLISNVKTGLYLSPVRIDKFYYVIRLKEIKEPYIPEFQAIKDKVKETLIKDTAKAQAEEKIRNCHKNLKENLALNPKLADFDRCAKLFGLKSASTEAFKYGSYLEGIGASDNLFTEAQGLEENQISDVINMPSGLYIIRLKSKVPIDEKKFTDEKTDFTNRLLLQKKQEHFSQFTQDLKQKAQLFN